MRVLEVTRGPKGSIPWSEGVEVQRVQGLVEAGHALVDGEFDVLALHAEAADPGLMAQVSAVPVVVVAVGMPAAEAVALMKLGAADVVEPGECEAACSAARLPAESLELAGLSAEGTWLLHADLIEREKLATVGQLATGLAHAINNPSAYVVANLNELGVCLTEVHALLDLALSEARAHGNPDAAEELDALERTAMYPGGLDEMKEMVAECLHGMRRITGIVNSLQGFRDDSEEPRPADVPRAIETAMKLAENEGRGRGKIETDLATCPRILASPARLSQVFFDLISNAIQSFDPKDPGEHRVAISCAAVGEEVQVQVEDNGRGIPAALLPRIWDPFFTIQEGHGALGLGLSICRDIVHRYGGELEIESEEGVGTKVRVRLPVPPELQPEQVPDESGKDPLLDATILVVDDEPAILRSVRRVLREAKDVRTAGSGREALRLLEEGPIPDLILCDLSMDDISGAELHHRLCEHHPEAAKRLWFLSGGAITAHVRDFAERHADRVLEKPFDPEVLRERLRKALR
jgi:two-component system cell cycle sensor histidine kinase/response regulator CckA